MLNSTIKNTPQQIVEKATQEDEDSQKPDIYRGGVQKTKVVGVRARTGMGNRNQGVGGGGVSGSGVMGL